MRTLPTRGERVTQGETDQPIFFILISSHENGLIFHGIKGRCINWKFFIIRIVENLSVSKRKCSWRERISIISVNKNFSLLLVQLGEVG